LIGSCFSNKNSFQSVGVLGKLVLQTAAKRLRKILIIPTENDSGVWYGNEYLQYIKGLDEGVNNQTGRSLWICGV
ncbi:hypothetical protein ACKU07_25155, partial [Enterobacter hormaechei]